MQTFFTIGTHSKYNDDIVAALKQHGIDAISPCL